MGNVAVRQQILKRRKFHDFAVSSATDFELGASEPYDSAGILSDPHISLYALDFERSVACFVELPANVVLETEPFVYLAQFAVATHLITISLDEFNELAAAISFDDSHLILVHSVGRCGSTLVSRVLESVPSVRSLSEPDAFTNLVAWRGLQSSGDSEIQRLLASCTLFCCKHLSGSTSPASVAIKFRSQCIEIDDLLAAAFPAAKRLYLTRDPIPRLASMYRAFVDPEEIEKLDYRRQMEDAFAPLHPLTEREVVAGAPMPVWKLILLDWIANSECFRSLQDRGIPYLVVDYAELKQNGLNTIIRILEYCELPMPDHAVIEECLARDSQQGSGIDQALVRHPSRELPDSMQANATELLKTYGYAVNG